MFAINPNLLFFLIFLQIVEDLEKTLAELRESMLRTPRTFNPLPPRRLEASPIVQRSLPQFRPRYATPPTPLPRVISNIRAPTHTYIITVKQGLHTTSKIINKPPVLVAPTPGKVFVGV